jgi:hypothetical protein
MQLVIGTYERFLLGYRLPEVLEVGAAPNKGGRGGAKWAGAGGGGGHVQCVWSHFATCWHVSCTGMRVCVSRSECSPSGQGRRVCCVSCDLCAVFVRVCAAQGDVQLQRSFTHAAHQVGLRCCFIRLLPVSVPFTHLLTNMAWAQPQHPAVEWLRIFSAAWVPMCLPAAPLPMLPPATWVLAGLRAQPTRTARAGVSNAKPPLPPAARPGAGRWLSTAFCLHIAPAAPAATALGQEHKAGTVDASLGNTQCVCSYNTAAAAAATGSCEVC